MHETNDILLHSRPLLGAVAFLLGTIFGSFINVISLRLPKMMEKNWRSQCCDLLEIKTPVEEKEPVFNLAFPASHCFNCKHIIHWWENIPVISYIILKGKCSNCQHPISIQYPLVEILTGIFSTAVIWQMGIGTQAYAALPLTWALITLAVIDSRTQLLPDNITLPLTWCGLIINIFSVFTSLENAVIGAVTGYLFLWTVFWIYKYFTEKEGMGYGDFKLLAALGAWMGWQVLPATILISSLLGTFIGFTMIIFKKRDSQTPIPFGPYLAAAGWISLMWGESIVKTFNSFYLF